MKRFQFRLDSLQRWRTSQRDRETAKLELLMAERRQLDLRQQRLELSLVQSSKFVQSASDVGIDDFRAAEGQRRFAVMERARIKAAQANCDQRIAQQRKVVIAAERQVQVLEQLRDQKLTEWRKEADKEQEDLVAELTIARWGRGSAKEETVDV